VAVIGESGSGKTVSALSALRLIPFPPGLIMDGSVLFHGDDLLKLPDEALRKIRGNRISMIFQEPGTALNPVMTVGAQIAEPLMFHKGLRRKEAYDRAAELLEKLDIPNARERLKHYPHQFSGGMQQRVMIAMAMSCDPQLLIADEPTTALDVTVQAQVLELLEKLRADFLDYGVFLERFLVGTFVKPEEDKAYQKFKELHFRQYADVAEARLRQQVGVIDKEAEAQRIVIEAQALAQKRATEGYSYNDERGFDVAERVASNQAVGQMTNLGVGLGMMTGVGGAVGATVGGLVQNAVGKAQQPSAPAPGNPAPQKGVVCAKCGATLPSGIKFCPECGEKVAPAGGEIVCPVCGAKTPGGKFCAECGAPLTQKCPECGANVSPGVKFCGECGHKMV
jgi:ABC-type lipoprotein export system ATPase subunit